MINLSQFAQNSSSFSIKTPTFWESLGFRHAKWLVKLNIVCKKVINPMENKVDMV